MRHLVIIILAVFATVAWAEEEKTEEVKLSANAIKAVDRYETDIMKARAALDLAVERAKQRLDKSLTSEMKSAMRKGDLDGANAIKELQAKLEDRTGLEEVDIFGNPIVEALPAEALVGEWSGGDVIFTIKADDKSSLVLSNSKGGRSTNFATLNGLCLFQWSNFGDIMVLDPSNMTLKCYHDNTVKFGEMPDGTISWTKKLVNTQN